MFICGNINKTVQPVQSKNQADTGKQSPVPYTVDKKHSVVDVQTADVDKKHSAVDVQIADVGKKHSVVDVQTADVYKKHPALDVQTAYEDKKHSAVDVQLADVDKKHADVDKKDSAVTVLIADVDKTHSTVAVRKIDADSSTAVGIEKHAESSDEADHPSDVGDRRELSTSRASPDTVCRRKQYSLVPHGFKKTPTGQHSAEKESHNADNIPRPATHQAWAEETVTEEEQKPDPQQTGSESDKRPRIYEDKSAKKTRNSLTFEGQEGQYFVDPKKDKSVQTVNEDRRQGDNAVHMSYTRAHTSMDSYNETRITKLRKQVALYRDDISNLRQQNSDLQTRLSKIMSERLTDNNPDIADLSDKNRPTNLAERFSELYSNEWSDAYEDLEQWAGSEREEEIIAVLLEIVTVIFNKCRDKSQDDMNKLTKMMMRVCGLSEWSENLSSSMKEIKDLRKRTYTGVVASLTEGIHGDVLEIVARHLHNDRLGAFLATESVRKYTETAVEICWLMAVQDPPICMQTSLQGTSFNKEMYKEYTRSGNHYDYLVWPALFLYEGGSMLAKGIAQAKEVVAQPRSSSANRTKNK